MIEVISLKHLLTQIKHGFSVQKYKDACIALIAILLLYGFFHISGIGCPIKFFTGISCAGCGMTRAWYALLHLNLKEAFFYHPGFFLPVIALFLFLLKNKLNKTFYKIFMGIIVFLFILIYFYRMFTQNSDIVVFSPDQSIIVRIFNYLK